MVDIVTRAGKGSPLTNNEVDANFTNLAEVSGVTGEPMGHEDRTTSTISFNASTRTFTIAPVNSSFTVWCKGKKVVVSSAQTVTIPNTSGMHSIYYDANGTLSSKIGYFTFSTEAPTAYVYWNATTGAAPYFGDERHGVVLDWQTHEYLHRTRGAAIANGFLASGYTLNNSATNAATQIAIESGTFFDEDMKIDIVSTATPTAGTYQQNLLFPAKIPVLHLQGTSWVMDAPTDFPFKQGTSRPQYNSVSGGVWSTTDVGNNQHATTWILATNNLTYPVIAIIGQSATDNLGEAEAFAFADLSLTGFPSVEFRPLYKLIYKASDGYANSVNAQLVSIVDLRSISAVGSVANPATDHGNLSGLSDDDHPQYLSVDTVRSGLTAAVKASFLPSQTGNAGKFLTTDATSTSWTALTSGNITTALGFTPYNATNPAGYITGITSSNVTTALGFTPYNATNPSGFVTAAGARGAISVTGSGSYDSATGVITVTGGVTSVNTRTGAVTITSADVTTALGFTPYNNTNPNGFLTGITSTQVTTALGYTPYNSSNPSGYITGITSGMVTTALGFTPYNNSNPSGYITSSALSGYLTSASAASTYLPLAGGTTTGQTILANAFRFYTGGTDGSTLYGDFRTNPATGNSIISAKTGALFFNYDHGTGGVIFSNGAQGTVGSVDASGNANFIGAITQNSSQVLHAGNVSTYALPIGGGTLTGVTLVKRNLGTNDYTNVGQHNLHLRLQRSSDLKTLELGVLDNGTGVIQANEAGVGYQTLALNPTAGSVTANGSIVLHAGNYNSYAPTLTGTGASGTWNISISGNAATATTLTSTQSSWGTGVINNVIGMLAWKNYGNGHVIFDASASTSPSGGAVDRTNANVAWSASYPTLMGWNGSSTYGVRVDSARVADSATSAPNYLPLTGGTLSGQVRVTRSLGGAVGATPSTVYSNNHFEARTDDGTAVVIALHRNGYSHAALIHKSTNSLVVNNNAGEYELLHAGNYNSYSPTLTGTGASGTWNINITGTAATATSAPNYLPLSGGTMTGPISYSNVVGNKLAFYYVGADKYGIDVQSDELRIFSGAQGLATGGITFGKHDGTTFTEWMRIRNNGTILTNGNQVLHAGNYNSYALPLTGGTLTGNLNLVGGKVIASSGGANTYGIFSGYTNNNHFIGLRCVVTGTTTSPTFTGNHQTTLVEYAEANDSTGWFFKSSEPGSYVEVARITRSGINWNGNTVLHTGNPQATTEWYHSDRDFPNGTLITTNINYAVSDGDAFVLEIRGNSYGNIIPLDLQYQGYIYSNTIINHGGLSNGLMIQGLVALNVGGKLCFWFPTQGYWNGYNVKVYAAFATRAVNQVTSITGTTKPSGTKEVALTTNIRQSLHSGNFGSYALPLSGDYTRSGTTTLTGVTVFNNYISLSGDFYHNGNQYILNAAQNGWINIVNRNGGSPFLNNVTYNGNTIFHAGNYTSYDSHLRALGFPSASTDWNSLGNGYQNSIIQVDPSNFASTASGPTAASYTYGMLLNFAAMSSSQAQIYISHAGNDLIFRGGWNGTSWQTWNKVLTNQNYNSYSPTLTGGNASGSWSISVTGTAASISGFNNPTTAATANTIAYRDAAGDLTVRELVLNVGVQDFTPSSLVAIYPTTNQAVKVTASGARNFLDVPTRGGANASGTWSITATSANKTNGNSGYARVGYGMAPFYNWGGANAGAGAPSDSTYTTGIDVGSNPGDQAYGFQIASNMWNVGLWTRTYNSGFSGWVRILDSSNYSSYALPISGGTLTGSRPIGLDTGGGSITSTGSTGGWSMGHLFYGSSGTYRGGFGALGGANDLSYYWVGQNYDDATMYVYPGSRVKVQRDLIVNGRAGGAYGNRIIVGADDTAYTLQDTNQRPTIQIHGAYPVLSLNHTVSNGNHGPTIQFTCNGVGNQFVIGTGGTGAQLDMGYSSNSDWNPHNGIAGYTGTTFFRAMTNGYIGLGAPGDWGGLGGGDPSYHLHFKGTNGTGSHAAAFQNTASALNGSGFLFQNDNGNHSWGIVSEFRISGTAGTDRPSILFSHGYNSNTWSVGFGYADDQFRINQNHGHRNGNWGTERFRIDTGGTAHFNGNVALHAGNYTSYAPNRGGDTLSGLWYFLSNRNTTSDSCPLQAFSNNGSGATMSFHRGGYYAVNFGLDSDNVMRIGGWSAAANRWQLDMSGNGTYAGNVTAYSDERLKKDWAVLPSDFIAKLATVKSGTYTRIDSGERQAGSSAQDWQTLLPEVVSASNDEAKTLALAYGNAALVSAVELAKEVVDLRNRVAQLESLINKLIGD